MTNIRKFENTMMVYLSRHHVYESPPWATPYPDGIYEHLNDLRATYLNGHDADALPVAENLARFPILNPCALMYRLMQGKKKPSKLLALAKPEEVPDIETNTSSYTDFQLATGRTLQEYTRAYEKKNSSVFAKIGKHLKKAPIHFLPDEIMLMYLAHPQVRYEARRQYLQGEHLPLLELDILSQWARRQDINMSRLGERALSQASHEHGDRSEEGELLSLSPTGKLLNRQQWVDTHKALLPYVLQEMTRSAFDANGKLECERLWQTVIAFFSVVSLHDDPSLFETAAALNPLVLNVLREAQIGPSLNSCDGLPIDEDIRRAYLIDKINYTFIPSSRETALSLMQEGVSLIESARASRITVDFPLLDNVAHIGAALSQPQALLRLDDHMLDVHGMLKEAESAWQHIRQTRLDLLPKYQSEATLHGAAISKADYTNCSFLTLPSGEDDATHSLLITDIAKRAYQHYSATEDTSEALETIIRHLDALGQRTRLLLSLCAPDDMGFIYDMDAGAAGITPPEGALPGSAILLPHPRAVEYQSKSLGELSDLDIDIIATEAMALASTLRRMNMIVRVGTHKTCLEGQQMEAAIAKAAENVAIPSSSQGSAYSQIEAKMEALDKARSRYRQWAIDNIAEMHKILLRNQDHLDFDIGVLFGSEDAPEPEPVDMVPAVELDKALNENSETLKAAMASFEKEQAKATAQIDALTTAASEKDAHIIELQQALEASEHRLKALNHHLERAERSSGASDGLDRAFFCEALLSYSEAPKPETALTIAEQLLGGQLIILPSAYESARQAPDMSGQNLLRRLLVLGSEGRRILDEGKPLYELKDVLPGDLALNESDTNMSVPKLRQQRVFKETRPDGSIHEWLMEYHNWIDFSHRLHFDYDPARKAFVIGHAGRHLGISSIS